MLSYKYPYRLLYVEDEELVRFMVKQYLSKYFKTIYEASDGEEAFKLYEEKNPDIIITDIKIPKLNGLKLVAKIRKQDRNIPIIITTAYTNTDYLLNAVELNLVKYLVKPVKEKKLHQALISCFQYIKLKESNIIKLTSKYQYDSAKQILVSESKEEIPLTLSQSKFIDLLIKNKDRTVTYQEIERHLWIDKVMSEAALRSLIYNLRQIFPKNFIKNVSKIGYKINLDG